MNAGGKAGTRWLRALARRPAIRRVRRLAAQGRTRDPLMLALAAAVGLGTGLLAVALIELIRGVQALGYGTVQGRLAVVALPTLGGLLVGILFASWMPAVRGGGVSDVMSAIALKGGRMPSGLAPAKLAASALNLGTGASGGREGPIVQIGGAVGSAIGRVFALDEEQKRALIAAGAGAGIAASFNAPIGGMLFALEVIIGGFRARYLQVVVVAAVVASVTARELVGPDLIYNPPPYRLGDPRELLLYALLGLAAAIVGIAFIRGEDGVARAVERLRVPIPVRMGIGGLGVGVLALAVPQVLGTGDHLPPVLGVEQEPIADMLAGGIAGMADVDAGWLAAGLLLVLLVAKLAATCLTIGTGNSVGSFGPAIFMGAALGGAFGHIAAALLPGAGVAPGGFALVGMAGVVGATSRAPLAAILLAFELTGDYGMVLPLMLTTGIATALADRLHAESIYTLPLRRRGIVYGEPEDVDIMQTVRVGEIMSTQPRTVRPDMSLDELNELFRRTRHHGFPVEQDGRLFGVVTISDLAQSADDTGDILSPTGGFRAGRTVGDICTREPLTVTPGDPVFRAMRRMATLDVGRLPVVSEEDHGQLVGLVRRADLVKAYQRAVNRSLGSQQRQASSRLRDLSGAQFLELVVEPDSPLAHRAVRDIAWPPRTLLTSVRRDGTLLMPNGDTTVQPGDELVVLTGRESADALRRLVAPAPRERGS